MLKKIFVCTIIGTLFFYVSGKSQQRTISFDCFFGVPPGLDIDKLGEKKKYPIDYCVLYNFDQYFSLKGPFIHFESKKTCIKIIDFVNRTKKRTAIACVIKWRAYNDTKYHALKTRLLTLQANAVAAYIQKFGQTPATAPCQPINYSTCLMAGRPDAGSDIHYQLSTINS